MVTRQLQVERRTETVRRPKTDVLPLSHATSRVGDMFSGRIATTKAMEARKLRREIFASVCSYAPEFTVIN